MQAPNAADNAAHANLASESKAERRRRLTRARMNLHRDREALGLKLVSVWVPEKDAREFCIRKGLLLRKRAGNFENVIAAIGDLLVQQLSRADVTRHARALPNHPQRKHSENEILGDACAANAEATSERPTNEG